MTDGNKQGSDAEKAIRDLQRAEADAKRGDLKGAEREAAEAVRELKEAEKHDHEVTIVVDGTDRRVRRGEWVVNALKAFLGIDPAKVLAKITPQGLVDLDDNARTDVHEKEKFMTHARSGGSS